MLERFFLKPQTVDRILRCWLGSRIEAYVTILCDQGYSTRTILRRVPILVEFASFTEARSVSQIEKAETLSTSLSPTGSLLDEPTLLRMNVAAIVTSQAPRLVSSSASSCHSRSIAARGSRGAIHSLPKRPDSSSISGWNAVCVKVPFASTSTICGDLNATSTRSNARTLDPWRCRSSPDSSRPRRKSSDPEPWWASAARCGSSCDTRTEKASTTATSASWSKDPSTTGWPTSLGRSAGTPSRKCSTRLIVEPLGADATTPCSCSWSPMGSGLARSRS